MMEKNNKNCNNHHTAANQVQNFAVTFNRPVCPQSNTVLHLLLPLSSNSTFILITYKSIGYLACCAENKFVLTDLYVK